MFLNMDSTAPKRDEASDTHGRHCGPLHLAEMWETPQAASDTAGTLPSYAISQPNILLASSICDLQQCQAKGDGLSLGKAWNSLGLVYLHTQGNTEQAIRCHLESLKHFAEDNLVEIASVLYDLGFCYERLKERKQAKSIYEQAMEQCHGRISCNHPSWQALVRGTARLATMD